MDCFEYKKFLDNAMNRASRGESLIPPTSSILELPGLSSRDSRHFLNNLNAYGKSYLEIGIHQGSTFISAMYGRAKQAYAIDNWSEIGNYRDLFLRNIQEHIDIGRAAIEFIEEDAFSLNLDKIDTSIDVYFYDGKHTKDCQQRALAYFYSVLSDIFLYIVDDWNFPQVRAGTREAIKLLQLETQAELEIRTPADMSPSFWNGYYAVFLKKHRIPLASLT